MLMTPAGHLSFLLPFSFPSPFLLLIFSFPSPFLLLVFSYLSPYHLLPVQNIHVNCWVLYGMCLWLLQ